MNEDHIEVEPGDGFFRATGMTRSDTLAIGSSGFDGDVGYVIGVKEAVDTCVRNLQARARARLQADRLARRSRPRGGAVSSVMPTASVEAAAESSSDLWAAHGTQQKENTASGRGGRIRCPAGRWSIWRLPRNSRYDQR